MLRIIFITFLLALSHLAVAQDNIRSMGAIGDSITAGAVANLHIGDKLRFSTFEKVFRFLGNFEYPSDIRYTRPVENQELSWATGDHRHSRSHFMRLKQRYPRLTQINYGISGAKAKHLFEEHIDNFMEESLAKFGTRVPDYVTYLIGGNDMCAESADELTSENDFYNFNRSNLQKLLQANPRSKILVSSLPMVDQLSDKMRNVRIFKTSNFFMRNFKCQNMWTLANFCQTLTQPQSPRDQEVIAARIRAFNQILEEIVVDLSVDHPGQIKYSSAFQNIDFQPAQLSMDCFHPSFEGQNTLADETWKDSFWRKDP